jgi:hypothetical protein
MTDLRLIEDYRHRPLPHRIRERHRYDELEQERLRGIEKLERYKQSEERPVTNSSDGTPYMDDVPFKSRQHSDEWNYDYLWERIRDYGIEVHAQVRWLALLETSPEHQLLAIVVKPVEGEWFPLKRRPNPWSPWHISICFNTDPITEADVRYIIKHFDNKVLHLRINWTQYRTGTSLELDRQRDPIASDPVVYRLFRNGFYGKKDHLHISV